MKFPRFLFRRPRPLVLALAPLLLTAPLLRAQQPSASPVDAAAVLAALKELKTKQTQVVAREKGQVLENIRAALADPVKAYEQATAAVSFQGKGGSEGAKLIEWRKENGELLRDRGFVNALRLQLLYIGLTWQRHTGVKTRDQLPALYDYTSQVVASYELLASLRLTEKPLTDSVFVAYFQIGPFINGLPEWEPLPFNVDGIFQKTILPELRKEKDPRLIAYWDNKIQTEAARIDQKSNGIAVNKFNTIRRPTLLWNRAEDEVALGDVNRAVADMLALIKTHPDHPDFDKWAARLTEVVSPKGEVIVRDAPTDSPAPSVAPQ